MTGRGSSGEVESCFDMQRPDSQHSLPLADSVSNKKGVSRGRRWAQVQHMFPL
jgi:hypothetical protein